MAHVVQPCLLDFWRPALDDTHDTFAIYHFDKTSRNVVKRYTSESWQLVWQEAIQASKGAPAIVVALESGNAWLFQDSKEHPNLIRALEGFPALEMYIPGVDPTFPPKIYLSYQQMRELVDRGTLRYCLRTGPLPLLGRAYVPVSFLYFAAIRRIDYSLWVRVVAIEEDTDCNWVHLHTARYADGRWVG